MVRPSLDRVLKCGEKACTSSLSSTGFSQQGINWRPKTSCNGERSQEIHSGIATAKNTVEHLPHDVNSLTASLRRWIYDVRYQRYVIHIVHITDTNEGKRLVTSDFTKVQANYQRIKPPKLAPSQKERNLALKKAITQVNRTKKIQCAPLKPSSTGLNTSTHTEAEQKRHLCRPKSTGFARKHLKTSGTTWREGEIVMNERTRFEEFVTSKRDIKTSKYQGKNQLRESWVQFI